MSISATLPSPRPTIPILSNRLYLTYQIKVGKLRIRVRSDIRARHRRCKVLDRSSRLRGITLSYHNPLSLATHIPLRHIRGRNSLFCSSQALTLNRPLPPSCRLSFPFLRLPFPFPFPLPLLLFPCRCSCFRACPPAPFARSPHAVNCSSQLLCAALAKLSNVSPPTLNGRALSPELVMDEAFAPPRALEKVCRSVSWRRKSVWRGTREMA